MVSVGRSIVIVALAAAVAGFGQAALGQALFGPAQDPLAGSRVFGDKGCVKCHAVNGFGGKVGPDLGRVARPRSIYDLSAAMWNHLPRMADRMRQLGIPRPRLEPQEAADLLAFLYTLDYFDPPGNVQLGRQMFVAKKCVVCHQVGGVGGVVGPNLDFLKQFGSPILIAAEMWNHGPAMAAAMRERKIERPTFAGSELRDLIAYLKAASPEQTGEPLYVLPGRAQEGQRLFVEKRCAQCHSAGGQSGRLAPDLAERGGHSSLTEFAAAMWNKAPAMMEVMAAQHIEPPHLQASEMADLVAYLYSVRYFAEPGNLRNGRAVATAKGCLGCHSVRGQGGKRAGDLARMKGLDSAATVIAGLWNHTFDAAAPAAGKGAWSELTPGEMADVVAYLRSLGAGQ
jgi:mono/diheme cytochrome c family protein